MDILFTPNAFLSMKNIFLQKMFNIFWLLSVLSHNKLDEIQIHITPHRSVANEDEKAITMICLLIFLFLKWEVKRCMFLFEELDHNCEIFMSKKYGDAINIKRFRKKMFNEQIFYNLILTFKTINLTSESEPHLLICFTYIIIKCHIRFFLEVLMYHIEKLFWCYVYKFSYALSLCFSRETIRVASFT